MSEGYSGLAHGVGVGPLPLGGASSSCLGAGTLQGTSGESKLSAYFDPGPDTVVIGLQTSAPPPPPRPPPSPRFRHPPPPPKKKKREKKESKFVVGQRTSQTRKERNQNTQEVKKNAV